MKPDRWKQIDELLDLALTKSPDQREAFLADVCAGDDELRRELDSLLTHDELAGAFLEAPPVDVAADLFPEEHGFNEGRVIGNYQIVSMIGSGGMGEVYLARDTRLNRPVAIKVLAGPFTNDSDKVRRFEQEARAASVLNHPNIVTIHEVGQVDGGVHFIVAEYIEGQTLRQRLTQSGPMNVGEALDIAVHVANALDAAHAAGIVHRDIKPENLMLRPDGLLKVLDFGLAKLSEPATFISEHKDFENQNPRTDPGTVMGTARYMSPEQALGLEVDGRTDLWSLGVVFFEMLTGKPPFDGETPSHVIVKTLDEPSPSLSALMKGVSPELESVINKSLCKKIDERYGTAREFAEDLKNLRVQLRAVCGLLESCLQKYPTHRLQDINDIQERTSATEKTRRYPATSIRKNRLRAAIVKALILAATAGLVLMYFREPADLRVDQAFPLVSGPELEFDPALSPDGKTLAYAAGNLNRMDVFIRPVAGGDVVKLTKDLHEEWHRWPRWSPDGTRIAFTSHTAAQRAFLGYKPSTTLRIVPYLGGTPRVVSEAVATSHAWSPDGTQLAFATESGIDVAALENGIRRTITSVLDAHSLSWSPDGRWIAYASGNSSFYDLTILGNQAPSAIAIVSAAGGKSHLLTDSRTTNVSPVWAPDSSSILFISDRGGSRDIYRLKVSSNGDPVGVPARMTAGLNGFSIDLSRDGHQVVYSTWLNKVNLWSIQIPSSGQLSTKAANPLTTGTQAIEGISVSQDGQWLAFNSNLDGNAHIYRMPRTGGRQEQLTTGPYGDFNPSWSPDGKFIAFHSVRNGNRDIYIMAADGSGQKQVTGDPAEERYADWSADGQSIVFWSDKTGVSELFIVSRENGGWGQPRQLTHEGGAMPRWSPDNKRIAYFSNRDLAVISPDGTARTVILANTPSRLLRFAVWSPDSQTIYLTASEPGRASWWSIPARGGQPKALVSFDDPNRPITRPEFATDGKEFFFTLSENESDIWMLKLAK